MIHSMFFHKKEEPRTMFYRNIAMTFIVLSFFVVGVVFYISFSWATIILTTRDQAGEKTLSVRIATDTNDEQGVIRGRIVTEELEGQGTFVPENASEIATKAKGSITIINTTAKPQILRETTRLIASDGTLFRTSERVIVEARKSLNVSVSADKEGDISSQTGSKFILPGLWPGLQDKIYGQGFEPREKGSATVRTLSEADVTKARETVEMKLREKFVALVENAVEQAGFHPKQLQIVLSSKILSSSTDKPIGAQTDTFSISIKSQITGIVFDGIDIKNYVEQVLPKELGNGYELMGLDIKKFEYTLEDIDRVGGKAIVSLHTVFGKIKSAEYLALEKRALVGKNAKEVIEYFGNMPDIANVRVTFYPFWVTRTPLLHDHIHIIVDKTQP